MHLALRPAWVVVAMLATCAAQKTDAFTTLSLKATTGYNRTAALLASDDADVDRAAQLLALFEARHSDAAATLAADVDALRAAWPRRLRNAAIPPLVEGRSNLHPGRTPPAMAPRPTAPPVKTMLREPLHCACFSMCSFADLAEFYDRIPNNVTSASSPWVKYLSLVYGEPPPLPFDLWQLRFFHLWHGHRTDWPTALCVWSTTHQTWARVKEQPSCGANECAAWDLAPAPGGAKPVLRREPIHTLLTFYSPRQQHANASAAALPSLTAVLVYERSRPTIASDDWVEVIRVDWHKPEGISYYGCWYWPAPGSGVWLNSGRTFVLEKYTNPRPLVDVWLVNHSLAGAAYEVDALRTTVEFDGATRSKAAAKLMPAVVRDGGREQTPFFAYDAGFDSLQTLDSKMYATEFVSLIRECVLPRNRTGQIGTCAPGSLRRGWAAAAECKCDPGSPMLRCQDGPP